MKSPPLSFAARSGDLLFVSGIPGFDDKGGLPESFEAQFAFVVKHQARARRGRRDLPRSSQGQRAADARFRRRHDERAVCLPFGPAPYPARTTCVVQALPDPKMLIEIEGVASLAGGNYS